MKDRFEFHASIIMRASWAGETRATGTPRSDSGEAYGLKCFVDVTVSDFAQEGIGGVAESCFGRQTKTFKMPPQRNSGKATAKVPTRLEAERYFLSM